jgi:hypothetical protein
MHIFILLIPIFDENLFLKRTSILGKYLEILFLNENNYKYYSLGSTYAIPLICESNS